MAASQTLLFPDPRPLVERLGTEFFRSLTERPGVYLMRDATEVVLYVGKAKNLKKRLNSYRVANPARFKRRHLRLLRLVVRIELQECSDETAALVRESELLRSLKPKFNRAGVWQGPRRFLGWRIVPTGLELAVFDAPTEGWTCTGPFGAQVIHLHRAMVRLLWSRFHPESGLAAMPAGWWSGRHGPIVVLQHLDAGLLSEQQTSLTKLAAGDANWLTTLPPARAAFEVATREEDLEIVTKHLVGRGLTERDRSSLSPSPTTPAPPRWY